MTNITTTNGIGKRYDELDQLPAHRQSAWETTMLDYQKREHERDTLRAELDAAHVRITQQGAEIDGLRSQLVTMESRAATCLIERDQAVRERAVFEVLFISINAQLAAFNVPKGETQGEAAEG